MHLLWGSRVKIPRGRLFYNSFGCKVITPTDSTYWPSHEKRQPDILNFFLSTIPNFISHSIHNVCDLTTDHRPVLLKMMEEHTLTPQCPSLSTGPINLEIFYTQLENRTN